MLDHARDRAMFPLMLRCGLRVGEVLGKVAPGVMPHAFRHYFVTSVLLGTGNLKLAQRLARHRDISSTQRYVHLADRELDEAYEELFNAD